MSEKPKRSPEWQRGFKHLSRVQLYCAKYISSWGPQAVPREGIWCDVLFIRSVAAVRSVLVLIDHDAVDDAAIIVRTMFEIEFQLGAVKRDPQIAVRLIDGSEAGRLKRLHGSGQPLPAGMTVEKIDQQLKEAKETADELQKRFVAKKAQLENEYNTFYSALSDIAHVSPVGLRHYVEELVEGEGNTPKNIRINPSGSLFSPELVMALASSTQLEILKIIRQIRAADQELEALLVENGQIIASVLQANPYDASLSGKVPPVQGQ